MKLNFNTINMGKAKEWSLCASMSCIIIPVELASMQYEKSAMQKVCVAVFH